MRWYITISAMSSCSLFKICETKQLFVPIGKNAKYYSMYYFWLFQVRPFPSLIIYGNMAIIPSLIFGNLYFKGRCVFVFLSTLWKVLTYDLEEVIKLIGETFGPKQFFFKKLHTLWSSTCPLTGFFWLLSHVIYLKLTKVL